MTDPRNEFCFDEWWMIRVSSGGDISSHTAVNRATWHAALDALRAKLAAKELWIAPVNMDDEMQVAAYEAQGEATTVALIEAWNAARDSYIAYYGTDYESGL